MIIWNCEIICDIRGKYLFYIIILIFTEKYYNDYGVIFGGICIKQTCCLECVEYDV